MQWLDTVNKSKKMRFYGSNALANLVPKSLYKKRLDQILASIKDYDADYIAYRVNYYNKLIEPFTIDQGVEIGNFKHKGNSAYVCDLKQVIRYFQTNLTINYLFGDVTEIPDEPAFVKSRPIEGGNQNSLLLKLDSVRHFNFVKDPIKFSDKRDIAIWRGAVFKRPWRVSLLEKYCGHPRCDVGDTDKKQKGKKYYKDYISFSEQLKYKFILSIEGTDVATNTKWIMSSNSLCFMPKPKFETWFMEGELIPNQHYVLLNDDYSDLEQKIDFYSKHPEEALKIIKHAQVYVEQFKDKKQERLIALLVMQKYFEKSGQL